MEFNFDEFLDFIKTENGRIADRCKFATQKEEIFAEMTKLMEESGEFASEVFIKLKHCRAEKMYENSAELAKEFADVAIVLFLLADRLGIDVRDAIKTKEEIIKGRDYKK